MSVFARTVFDAPRATSCIDRRKDPHRLLNLPTLHTLHAGSRQNESSRQRFLQVNILLHHLGNGSGRQVHLATQKAGAGGVHSDARHCFEDESKLPAGRG